MHISHYLPPLMLLWSRRHLTRTVPRLYQVANELLNKDALPNVPTHELLTRLLYVYHPKPGLVHWMPMGMEVLNKLKAVVHKNMKAAGAEEVSLSAISHSSLWEITGRWKGTELFKLKDSGGTSYCLAPTCEEEITSLVKSHLRSYKQLPLLYYQINPKFRDEKRPRSGLLRGREFIMKDAYSFDLDEAAALKTYENMVQAYYRIFAELKVPFVKADADSGDIGGSLSHEWHYVHESGEDTLFTCSECGNSLNMEKTLSFPTEEKNYNDVLVSYFTTVDRNMLVCAYYPTTRTLQPRFLSNEIPDIDLSGSLSEEQILDEFRNEEDLISKRIVRIMDSRLTSQSNFPDFPIRFINRSLITTLTDIPIVEAEEGEVCGVCEDGHLEKKRAIEVGHTFYLGTKYTEALDCSVEVPRDDGSVDRQNVQMGCYGIGLSRIIASVAEINRDQYGLRWPSAIAPWHVTVVDATNEERHREITGALDESGVEFRVDTREKVGFGRKVKESHAMGIPLVVIVGKNYPKVEIEVRGLRNAETWKKVYDQRDFDWEHGSENGVERHIVAVEDVGRVVATLLADM